MYQAHFMADLIITLWLGAGIFLYAFNTIAKIMK